MADYITRDQLNEFFVVNGSSDTAKDAAITQASRMIDRWAGVEADYFEDAVPPALEYAVKKYAVHILRNLDPVAAASAGITAADGERTVKEVREIAEMHAPTIKGTEDEAHLSRAVPFRLGF